MAEHDGKVTFDLEIDTSKVRGDLNKAFAAIKSQANSAKIKVDADTGAATTNLHRVKAEADAVNNAKPIVNVGANTDAAIDGLHDVEAAADGLNGKEANVNATATTDAAIDGLNDVDAAADSLNGKTSTVDINATDSASETLENVRALADDLNGKSVNVNVNSGGSNFKNGIVQGVGQSVGSNLLQFGLNTIGSVFTSGMGYETGLAKASTLMPAGADRDAYGRALLDLAAETGMDIGTMTEATYNALSASQSFGDASGDEMIDFLRTASKTAVGGFSDTNSVATALAKTINAYDMETSDAAAVANIMLKTQNRGITDVDKLSSSLSHVTATAANAGVDFEQVGAMLSTITAQGVETAEATTQSRSLITELVKADTTANKNMQAALVGTQWEGKSFSAIMAEGGNIVDVISEMGDYAKREGLTMNDMFSSVEAAQAAQMLLVNGGETFRDNLEYMRDEADIVDEAYSTMAETTEMSLARIKSQFAGYAAQFFTALAPAIEKFLKVIESDKFKGAVGGLVDKLSNMLSGDFVERAADGLINLIDWILDLINDPWGTISSGLTSILESAWDWLTGKVEEFGEWIAEAISAAFENVELPEWLQWLPKLFQGGSGDGDRTGSPGNGWSGGGAGRETGLFSFGKKGKGGAEDLSDSISDTTAAIDSANESASTMAESQAASAEYQAQIAASSEQSAASLETAADSESQSAKAAQTAATKARQMATRLTSLNSGISGAVSAAINLPGAISSLVAALNRSANSAGGGYSSGTAVSKNAVGLDRVPFDNYPALLHKGEMVLTAAEASAYRMTGSANNGGGFNAAALAAAMNGVAVEMDGRVVGRLVERSVSAQQAVRLNRTQYGRG